MNYMVKFYQILSKLRVKNITLKLPKRNLLWKMHLSQKICAATWIDKRPIILFFTHAQPIPREGEIITVPRCINNTMIAISFSLIHIKYITYMHGVNITDQFRVSKYNRISDGI